MTSYNIKINLTKKENDLIMEQAKLHKKSVENYISNAIYELIEDIEDIKLAKEAHEEWAADNYQTISHEEMMKKYGL